jgi:hypothetical protein
MKKAQKLVYVLSSVGTLGSLQKVLVIDLK